MLPVQERMRELIALLQRYNYHYHTLGKPMVPDSVYDRTYNKLLELEETYPNYILPVSPTQLVGSRIDKTENKVKHLSRILSLNNAFNRQDIERFLNVAKQEEEYIVEEKIDGLALSLIYEEGVLIRAVTRGDGIEGEDVTQNALRIKSIPKIIPNDKPGPIDVRGEVYMAKSVFERLNKELVSEGKKPFANPRNAAAGSLRLQNAEESERCNLSFVAYDVVGFHDWFLPTYQDILKWLEGRLFSTPIQRRVVKDIEDVLAAIKVVENERQSLPYPVDGAVIKLTSIVSRRRFPLGRRAPTWALAFKFPAKSVKTKLTEVNWQVGRTGQITPVAKFDPIELDGSTVTFATLHNAEEVNQTGYRIGDTIYVSKAGDIIPYVNGVAETIHTHRRVVPPVLCPSCSSETVMKGVHLFCVAGGCNQRNIRELTHFCSDKGLAISCLGSRTLLRLYESNVVRSITDLYDITPEELGEISWLGKARAVKICKQIERTKHAQTHRVISSLSIPNISQGYALTLARHLKILPRLLTVTMDELLTLPRFTPFRAQQLLNWVSSDDSKQLVEALVSRGIGLIPHRDEEGVYNVVVTGSHPTMARRDISKLLKEKGFHFQNTVTNDTHYLVALVPYSAKLSKAKDRGIEVVSSFEELFEKTDR